MLVYNISLEDAKEIADEITLINVYSTVFGLSDFKVLYYPHDLRYCVSSESFSFTCSDSEDAHSILRDFSKGVMIV